MAVKPKPPVQEEEQPMHPIARAAWQGYSDYKKEMDKRRHVPAWTEFSLKTAIRITVVVIAFFLVLDFIKRSGVFDLF